MTDREELARWVAQTCGWELRETTLHPPFRSQTWDWCKQGFARRSEAFDWLAPPAIWGDGGLVAVMRGEGWEDSHEYDGYHGETSWMWVHRETGKRKSAMRRGDDCHAIALAARRARERNLT